LFSTLQHLPRNGITSAGQLDTADIVFSSREWSSDNILSVFKWMVLKVRFTVDASGKFNGPWSKYMNRILNMEWEQANQRYLMSAIGQVRAMLERFFRPQRKRCAN